MPTEASLPARPPQTPGFPSNPQPLIFEGFSSLNTRPTRPAIEDQEMFICDGWMPIGKNNLRTLPGAGTAWFEDTIYSSGVTIVLVQFANIGSNPYAIIFLSDGSIDACRTDVASSTVNIAPAGTITDPSATTMGISQWGSKYIIIVSTQTNGYFVWDGTNLFQAGGLGPGVDITDGGLDYTSSPTITAFGGEGSGATFTSTVKNGSVDTITVTNPGSGYSYVDEVYLAFSGGGSNTTATAVATVSGSSLDTVAVVNPGSGYTQSTTSVSLVGGGGTGASITIAVASGTVQSFSIAARGEGYTSAPTVVISDSGNTVAQAAVTVMPFGISGSAVETFTSRVWIVNGYKIEYSASGYVSDFNTADGSGVQPSTDSFLRIGFTQVKQSNGFLYLLADSSMNYISGVQTNSSTAITTFTNQNVDPQIGTPWPLSVQVFSRNVVFANSFGVHVSYGGSVTKVSSQLDGLFSTVSNFGGFQPSSAVAVIFGIHVYMLLLPVIDQVSGQQVNKLLMWDGQRWWTAQQGPNLIQIATQEINSVMTAWGTDGQYLYPLFQTTSSALTKTVQSKLWDTPGYYYTKVPRRVFGLANYNEISDAPLSISVDSNLGSTTSSQTVVGAALTWTNDTGATISWTNSTGATIVWGASGLSVFGFATAQPGQLIGVTVSTTAPDVTLVSITVIEQNFSTRL
jgi:hypothetical protein